MLRISLPCRLISQIPVMVLWKLQLAMTPLDFSDGCSVVPVTSATFTSYPDLSTSRLGMSA